MSDLNGTLPNAATHGEDNQDTLEYWQRLVGKTYIGEDEEKTALGEDQIVLHTQLPKGHRVLAPNTLMTKDFRPWRLNVTMDHGSKITGVYFG